MRHRVRGSSVWTMRAAPKWTEFLHYPIIAGTSVLAIAVTIAWWFKVDAQKRITATVPRHGLWLAQTPQVFRREWLVDAYARRKELGAVAKNAAEKVKEYGEPVKLEPMSAFERKCVHDVINALSGVESESEGVEPQRRIVVRAVS